MGYVFKKLFESEFVSLCDGFGFKKLTLTAESPKPPIIFENSQIDLSVLGLTAGSYRIAVTALSTGLDESRKSQSIGYKAE